MQGNLDVGKFLIQQLLNNKTLTMPLQTYSSAQLSYAHPMTVLHMATIQASKLACIGLNRDGIASGPQVDASLASLCNSQVGLPCLILHLRRQPVLGHFCDFWHARPVGVTGAIDSGLSNIHTTIRNIGTSCLAMNARRSL